MENELAEPACTSCLLQCLLKPVPVRRTSEIRMNGVELNARNTLWLRRCLVARDICIAGGGVSVEGKEAGLWPKGQQTRSLRHKKDRGEEDDGKHSPPSATAAEMALSADRTHWAAHWQTAGVVPGRESLNCCIKLWQCVAEKQNLCTVSLSWINKG